MMELLKRHRNIPQFIRMRVQDVADVTRCYLAFDKDGSCWIYPYKPRLSMVRGTWEPTGRIDLFQCEEVKFTKKKYRYSDWNTLFCPRSNHAMQESKRTYNPTRDLRGIYV